MALLGVRSTGTPPSYDLSVLQASESLGSVRVEVKGRGQGKVAIAIPLRWLLTPPVTHCHHCCQISINGDGSEERRLKLTGQLFVFIKEPETMLTVAMTTSIVNCWGSMLVSQKS